MNKKIKTIENILEQIIVPVEEQPYEVPSNWVWTKFGNVAKLYNGYAFKSTDYQEEGIPVIRISDISRENTSPQKAVRVPSNLYNERFLVKKGDLLIAMSGATTGKTGIYNSDMVALQNQRVGNIREISQEVLNPKFKNYFVFNNTKEILKKAYGGAQPNISGALIEQLSFPLPPLGEQKRIVEKVELLLNKIEEAEQLIEEVKETFELRQSTIIKSILQEGIVDSEIPEGWESLKIANIFSIFGGGTPSKSKDEYWNGEIPWISAKDMKKTFISETMDCITEEGLKNSSAKLAKRGSIAMVVRSGILQRTLPVAYLLTECTVNQDLKVFDSGNELINKYLLWYIKGNEKSLLYNYSKSGTTVNSIEFAKFKSHELLLPPMDILKRKIEKIENAIFKEETANEVLKLANSIDTIKQSILSKAFRGELGTNDPTEENAYELLKEVLQEQVK